MRKLARLFLSTALFVSLNTAFADIQKSPLAQAKVNIPYGDSFWDVNLPQLPVVEELQLNAVQNSFCGPLTYRVDYLPSNGTLWVAAPFQNGFYHTPGQSVRAVRVWLNQRTLQTATCDLTLQNVRLNAPQQPAPGEATYAGVIDYKGGFALNQTLSFPTPFLAQRIDVLVPEFCKGVQILELNLSQQGQVSKASPLANKENAWILPQAKSFDQAQITLNGPVGLECQIPVYVYKLIR